MSSTCIYKIVMIHITGTHILHTRIGLSLHLLIQMRLTRQRQHYMFQQDEATERVCHHMQNNIRQKCMQNQCRNASRIR
jgi:hypothetical protein